MSNDDLDDIFGDEAKKAKPAGKFQPKPKFRPQRKDSAKTSVAPSKTVQTVVSAPSQLSEPIVNANPSEQSSNVVSNEKANLHAVTEQSVGENADISIGLEALGDVLPQTTIDKDCSVPPSAAVALNVPNSENIGGSESSILFSFEDSTYTSNVVDFPTSPGLLAEVAPVNADGPIVSKADLQDTAQDRDLGREVMDALDSIDMAELPATNGQRKGRFQPKRKLQMPKKTQASEPVSNSVGSQSVPSEIEYVEMDSVPTSHQDDVLDLSSLGFTHTLPSEATSELPLNQESMNLMEVAELDTCIHLDDLPEIPAKLASRRAKAAKTSKTHAASDSSSQQQSSQENGTGKSLRPRKGKRNMCELVDEDGDEILATEETEERSPVEEENTNNDESQVENESQKKKSKRKSKKTDDGKEKPPKKSKKAKEVSEQEGAKRKKFPHSTRRRRVVDKTLLETPEDEIDHQKLPLRDLIILAEHREREMKKAGSAAEAPATNQSTGNNSSGLYNNEDFNYEEGGENYDEPQMVDTTEYFNYQSHMDKTRTKRWSKQETELFYEAVRMFGSDLSMITVRLPGRSRREVKLKYKKEERQQPLMLHEALANRSKDRSQFEMVVKHLRKIAAEENEDADMNESMDLPDEGISNADDDEAKQESVEEEENENAANDEADVEIPVKLDEDVKLDENEEEDDDDEDGYFAWANYKS